MRIFGANIFLDEVKAKIQRNYESLSIHKSSLYYLHGLIADWNEKHLEISDVALLNLYDKTDVFDNAVRIISKQNTIVLANANNCGNIKLRKVAFFVITTNASDEVKF